MSIHHIERIAHNLEPLAPEDVAYWRSVRPLVSDDTRRILDQKLESKAKALLGSASDAPLLSLPGASTLQGEICLGNVVYGKREHHLVHIPKKQLIRHLAILGMSGSGKTNTVLYLLKQLVSNNIAFIFLDWKRNARQYLPSLPNQAAVYTPGRSLAPLVFNPFICPPGIEEHAYISKLSDLLAGAYELREASKNLFQNSIAACYANGNRAPSATQVREMLFSLHPDSPKDLKLRASRALESLQFANLSSQSPITQKEVVERLLQGFAIIELDALSEATKRFLIPLLCTWIYHKALPVARREELNLVLILEEAHHIFGTKGSSGIGEAMQSLIRQCRELGIGVFVIDQNPSQLPVPVLGNCATSICLNFKEEADRKRAAGLSLMKPSESHYFSKLPVGHAVVKIQDTWNHPILVHIPLVEINKGSMSDQELLLYIEKNRATEEGLADTRCQTTEPPRFQSQLTESERAFLQDVRTHPIDPVSVRYKRLGLSCEKGQRVRDMLLSRGLITSEMVHLNNSHRSIITITDEGGQLLGIPASQESTNESTHHLALKQFYADLAKSFGYRSVTLEATIGNGAADVVVQSPLEDGKPWLNKLAIEIETGENPPEKILKNLSRNLSAGVNRVLVIATSTKALERINRIMSKYSFLLPIQDREQIKILQNGNVKDSDFQAQPKDIYTSYASRIP